VAASIALAESSQLHVVAFWYAEHESTLLSSSFLKVPNQQVENYIKNIERSYQQSINHLLDKGVEIMGMDAVDHLSPTVRLLKGRPKQHIPLHAAEIDADLVIMGTAARTGIKGFMLGNTVEDILPSLQHSVLTLKAS
jgi:universal stress protein E